MKQEYNNPTEVFLSQYGVITETKELPIRFFDDADGVQHLNEHLKDVELGERLAIERFSHLRFVG
ncbi:MAG: hypothetical protein WC781_02095 [Candidatus Pacearchaeota archaeon]|jgi:hypothetical protein